MRMVATRAASRPSTCPSASTRCQLRVTCSFFGIAVDMRERSPFERMAPGPRQQRDTLADDAGGVNPGAFAPGALAARPPAPPGVSPARDTERGRDTSDRPGEARGT